jgi:hypothetical protein
MHHYYCACSYWGYDQEFHSVSILLLLNYYIGYFKNHRGIEVQGWLCCGRIRTSRSPVTVHDQGDAGIALGIITRRYHSKFHQAAAEQNFDEVEALLDRQAGKSSETIAINFIISPVAIYFSVVMR